MDNIIRELAKSQNISIVELSQATCLSYKAIYNVINGDTPKLDTAYAISKALHCDIAMCFALGGRDKTDLINGYEYITGKKL